MPDAMHVLKGAISEVKKTELGSTCSLYALGGRLSLGAESVLQQGHLSCSEGLRSTPPSSLAKALDEASSPFKFGKYRDLTTTTYVEYEFFVFPHAVSQGEVTPDHNTPAKVVQETEMLQPSTVEVQYSPEEKRSLERPLSAKVPITTTPIPPSHQQRKTGTIALQKL
jgi:hypothetical protein